MNIRNTQKAVADQLKVVNEEFEKFSYNLYDYVMYYAGEEEQKMKKKNLEGNIAVMKVRKGKVALSQVKS